MTAGGGDPVASGLRVGDVMRLTGASEAANNGINFTITGFSRRVEPRPSHVYPAPTTMAADSAFTMAGTGGSLIVPASGHVSESSRLRSGTQDIDVAQVFTECRVGGFNIQLPPTGIGTVEFTVMGRDGVAFEAGSRAVLHRAGAGDHDRAGGGGQRAAAGQRRHAGRRHRRQHPDGVEPGRHAGDRLATWCRKSSSAARW